MGEWQSPFRCSSIFLSACTAAAENAWLSGRQRVSVTWSSARHWIASAPWHAAGRI